MRTAGTGYCAVRRGVLSRAPSGHEIAIATREASSATISRRWTNGPRPLPRRYSRRSGRARVARTRLQLNAIRQIMRDLRPDGRQARDDDTRVSPSRGQRTWSKAIRLRGQRRQRWLREGEPSVGRRLAQIGVLGWIIVVPTLLGVFLGRWLDQRLGTGMFWTAPLLMLGLALGCWSAWKWMQDA